MPLTSNTPYAFYNAVGRRDPFISYLDSLSSLHDGRVRTKLERYDLEQLRLVAVVTSTSVPRALIEDPDGQGHVVMKGARVGRNQGRIKSIRTDEIIIREEIRTAAEIPLIYHIPMRLASETTPGTKG